MNPSDKLEMYNTEGLNDPIWIIVIYVFFVLFYIIKIFFTNKEFESRILNESADNTIELQLFSNKLIYIASFLTMTIPLALSIQYVDFDIKTIEKCLYIIFSFITHIILVSLINQRDTKHAKTHNKGKRKNEVEDQYDDLLLELTELTDYLIESKTYIKNNLTLQELANEMGWSRSKLSFIINKGFEKNFYDYINDYRLELVIQKLQAGNHKEYSLDYIVNESGFKSYVSFYRFFKRRKLMSPKEFLNKIEKNKQ